MPTRTALLALALIAPATPALALFGGGGGGSCDPTDNDRMEATRTIRAINGRISAAEAGIVAALQKHAGQSSGYQAQSTKVLTQAMDAQNKVRAQTAREIEESRAVASRRVTPAACAAATGMGGLETGRRATAAARARASRSETGRLVGDRSVVATPGSDADTNTRYREITGTWCSEGRSGDPTCTAPAANHAADVRPATLFERSTFRSDLELQAAVALARNVVSPVVPDPPARGAAETAAERRNVIRHRAADSRTAVASSIFEHLRALRAPAADLGAWANALAPGSVAPGRISRYETLETLASRRLEQPGFWAEIQGMSHANLLRALTQLQATQLILDWERFQLEQRTAAALAAHLAIATEETRRLPGLRTPAGGTN